MNGYAGVDFNGDDVSLEEYHLACQRLADDGVAGFLATVITDEIDAMSLEEQITAFEDDEPEAFRRFETRSEELAARARAAGCSDEQMTALTEAGIRDLTSTTDFGSLVLESVVQDTFGD